MENMIDNELVKELRAKRAWSQEELSGVSGLSNRTIQRIEATGNCSMDSKRALASAFDISVSDLELVPHQHLSLSLLKKYRQLAMTVATVLVVPMFATLVTLAVRNQQNTAEFVVFISELGDVSEESLSIDLSQERTEMVELRDGYSLEIDYFPGITPRLKAQLYLSDERGKRLLHSSNRIGTEFNSVRYVVCSGGDVRFISPDNRPTTNCIRTRETG